MVICLGRTNKKLVFDDNDLGHTIRVLRKGKHLSQRELSELADVSETLVYDVERGCNTTIDSLSRIANALDKRLFVEFV